MKRAAYSVQRAACSMQLSSYGSTREVAYLFYLFVPSYLVLFPRTLSPKLPVLTLALANSSTSKQKTDTEQGIFMLIKNSYNMASSVSEQDESKPAL